jgi:hypothetical protein
MLLLAPGAGLLVLLGWLLVAGFEGHEVSPRDWVFLVAAAIGLVATLTSIAGLAARSRLITALGVMGQVVGVALLAVIVVTLEESDGFRDAFPLILLSVLVADLVAMSAVVMPPSEVSRGEVSQPDRDARAALVLMGATALLSAGFLLTAFVDGGAWGLTYGVVGGIGIAGAIPCCVLLVSKRWSTAGGIALAQAVLATMTFAWLSDFSTTGALLLGVVLVADVLTMLTVWLRPQK